MSARRLLVVLGGLGALVVLGTFRIMVPDEGERAQPKPPPHDYSYDPKSGEIRASMTAEDGELVRLHSGQKVPLRLPDGFALFPDAEVIEHHRVERGEGSQTVLLLTSAKPVADVAQFYLGQAEAAGVAVDVHIVTPEAITYAGRSSDGLSFSLTARRDGAKTRAQLSVGHGL